MKTYLMGLFVDVNGRAKQMHDKLLQLQTPALPAASFYTTAPLRSFIGDTLARLDTLTEEVNGVIDERTQLHATLAKFISDPAERKTAEVDHYLGAIVTYTSLYLRLQRLEYRYTVIAHYGPASAGFSQFLARIYAEIGLAHPLPVVSLISKAEDYYNANCEEQVICAPIEEEHHLLNWPDLYHEIAHFVFIRQKEFLLGQGRIEKAVKAHFAAQIEASPDQKTYWLGFQSCWTAHWLMEFCCDLIATYLTGCAYAWSNFRLSSIVKGYASWQLDRHIYATYTTHPPNEARMRAIFRMLERCGWQPDELAALRDDWDTYAHLSHNVEPADYQTIVPDALIDLLVESVFAECPNVPLRSYHEQLENAPIRTPIAHLLNVAWQELLARPDTYPSWEADTIRQLHALNTPTTLA
jgi:hypothetical protein